MAIKKYLLLLFSFLLSVSTYAQTLNKVVFVLSDSLSNESIDGVVITCKTNGTTSITDATGEAQFLMNSNIANNFPVPTTNVYVMAPARCNGNGVLNVCSVLLAIYNNNAMQMINVAFANGQPATQALSWNIANISLYGITYSRA